MAGTIDDRAFDPSSNSISSEASSVNLEVELSSHLKALPVIIKNSNDLQKLLKGELKSFKQTGHGVLAQDSWTARQIFIIQPGQRDSSRRWVWWLPNSDRDKTTKPSTTICF